MNMQERISALYNYCTDFVINLANITGLSYYEINFIIFLVAYPAVFLYALLKFSHSLSKYLQCRRAKQ